MKSFQFCTVRDTFHKKFYEHPNYKCYCIRRTFLKIRKKNVCQKCIRAIGELKELISGCSHITSLSKGEMGCLWKYDVSLIYKKIKIITKRNNKRLLCGQTFQGTSLDEFFESRGWKEWLYIWQQFVKVQWFLHTFLGGSYVSQIWRT